MNSATNNLLFVMAMAIVAPFPLRAQTPQLSIEDIIAVWTKRQAEIKTATISWRERRTIKKGVYPTRPTGQPAEPNPGEDGTFEFPSTLTFSGDKLRFSSHPQIWSLEARKWVVDPYVYTFNGVECRRFHDKGLDRFPTGGISAKEGLSSFASYHLYPVLMAIRPVAPDLAPINVHRIKTTGNSAMIGNSLCVELTMPQPTSRSQTLFWADPTKQFAIARYEYRAEEKLKLRITTSFALDPVHGWLPNQWDGVSMMPDGKMKVSFHSEVTSLQINHAIPDNEFDFVFPEGTRVFDETQSQTSVSIVKSDGNFRRVRGSELSRLSEDLIASDPPTGIRGKNVFVGMSLAVLVCAAIYWHVRAYQRRWRGAKMNGN